MTGLGADIKAGIKGIKGAGDAIRGTALQAADEAFDKNPSDPQTRLAHQKNSDIAESGKQDVRLMDEHMGERERRKKGMPSAEEAARGEGYTGGVSGNLGQADVPFEQQGGMRGQHVSREQVESGRHVPGQEIPGNHLPTTQKPRVAGNVGLSGNAPGTADESSRNF